MSTVQESIDIQMPVDSVYNQWTQFEDFPKFMEGVLEVKQLTDERLHWIAEIAGKRREWEAEIVEQVPDQRIAWRSIDGALNAGVVTFQQIDDRATRVALEIEFEPEGMVEKAGDMLGMVRRRVQGDLERFKAFIEEREMETGAWRGEIQGGETVDTPDDGTERRVSLDEQQNEQSLYPVQTFQSEQRPY